MTYRRALCLLALLVLCGLMLSPATAQEQPLNLPTLQGLADMAKDTRSLGFDAVFVHTDGNTTVTEFGASDTFTVALSAQPAGDVKLLTDSFYNSAFVLNPSTLTFTPDTWNIPQTVTMYAVHNYFTSSSSSPRSFLFDAEMSVNGVYRFGQLFPTLQFYVIDTPMTVPTGDLVVTTLEDSVETEIAGSLRQMINIANARAGADTITFAPNLSGTSLLMGSLPPLSGSLTISGSAQSTITLDGRGEFDGLLSQSGPYTDAVLTLNNLTFDHFRTAVLTENGILTDVTIQNSGQGASMVSVYSALALFPTGTLTRVTMTGNSGVLGGAVIAGDGVTITDSVFTDNHAYMLTFSNGARFGFGGAIYTEALSLNITNSTFANNSSELSGGAIYIAREFGVTQDINLSHNTFTNNTAEESGGAVYVAEGVSALKVSDSTFTANTAVKGGAIAFDNSSGFILNSTFSQNSAETGGAIYGNPYVFNSTFSANTATISGAAIDGSATVFHSTFSGHNTSVSNGVSLLKGGVLIVSSIIAHNNAPDPFECGTPVFAFAIRSDDPNCSGRLGKATGVDPILRDNGGSTYTHRLLAGSNAINNEPIVDDGMTGCEIMESWLAEWLSLPLTDQRGIARPYGDACDLGAFEYKPDYGLIRNGSFENAGITPKNARQWQLSNPTTDDRRICHTQTNPIARYDGKCVFQFFTNTTPAYARSLKHVMTGTGLGTTGQNLILNGFIKANKLKSGAKINLTVTYLDNTVEKSTFIIPDGTYAFTEVTHIMPLTASVKKIVVNVSVGKTKGRLLLDNLSLKLTDTLLLEFPTTISRDGANVDLPAAPDGFRN